MLPLQLQLRLTMLHPDPGLNLAVGYALTRVAAFPEVKDPDGRPAGGLQNKLGCVIGLKASGTAGIPTMLTR